MLMLRWAAISMLNRCFDPDETRLWKAAKSGSAMKNAAVIEAFNQCRSALFYRMRGQHRHPRTERMLRYYFTAQDIHERISSAHFDYRDLAERLQNTDLIFPHPAPARIAGASLPRCGREPAQRPALCLQRAAATRHQGRAPIVENFMPLSTAVPMCTPCSACSTTWAASDYQLAHL